MSDDHHNRAAALLRPRAGAELKRELDADRVEFEITHDLDVWLNAWQRCRVAGVAAPEWVKLQVDDLANNYFIFLIDEAFAASNHREWQVRLAKAIGVRSVRFLQRAEEIALATRVRVLVDGDHLKPKYAYEDAGSATGASAATAGRAWRRFQKLVRLRPIEESRRLIAFDDQNRATRKTQIRPQKRFTKKRRFMNRPRS